MIARAATVAGLLVALLPGLLAPPAGATTVAPSRTDFANEVPVALTPVGAGLLLLTDHPATAAAPGVLGKLQARTGVVSGPVVHWSAPLELSGSWQVYGDSVQTATAANGLTAIAWQGIDTSQVDPNDQAAITSGRGQAVVVVVRTPTGVWQGPYSTGAITTLTDVTADAAGDVAVIGYDVRDRQRALVRSAAGDWRVLKTPKLGLESIRLDGRGVVHGVVHNVARGGDGTVAITRLAAGASSWSRPARVRPAGGRVQDAQLLVSDTGRETLVVGSDSRHWRSTYDTEAYFATSYRVLQRKHGRFVSVWQRDGAERLSAALGSDGRLQLLWTQDRKPSRHHWPTRFRLLTQQVLPAAGPVSTLTSGATYRAGGVVHSVDADALFLGPAPGNAGVGALWLAAGSLHAWWNGSSAPLPVTPTPAPSWPLGAVGAMSSAPVVAWVSSSTTDSEGAYLTATGSAAVLLP